MFIIGDWTFDPITRRLNRDGEAVRISPKASKVLWVLASANGDVVFRSDILSQVWPVVTVGEEVLTHAIAELRSCLGDSARAPRYIETIHKAGYRLCVKIGHFPSVLYSTNEVEQGGISTQPGSFPPIWSLAVTSRGQVRPVQSGQNVSSHCTAFGWIVIRREQKQLAICLDIEKVTSAALSYLKLELDECRVPIFLRYHHKEEWKVRQFQLTEEIGPDLNAMLVMGLITQLRNPYFNSYLNHQYLDMTSARKFSKRVRESEDLVTAWSSQNRQVDYGMLETVLGEREPDSISVKKVGDQHVFTKIKLAGMSKNEVRDRIGMPVSAMSGQMLAAWLIADYERMKVSVEPRLGRTQSVIAPAIGPILSTRYRLVLPNRDQSITTFLLPMRFSEFQEDRILPIG